MIRLGITLLFGAIIAYGVYAMRARIQLPVAHVSSHEIEIQLLHPHPRLNFPVLKFFMAIGIVLASLDSA